MSKRFLIGCSVAGVFVLAFVYMIVTRQTNPEGSYPSPRFPGYLFKEPTDEELRLIARKTVRQMGGWTALGRAKLGEKILIMVPEGQDVRLVQAIIAALKDRGVEADYILNDQLVQEALGIPRDVAKRDGILLDLYGEGIKDGYREAFRWPQFFPEKLREKMLKELDITTESMGGTGSTRAAVNLLRQAMRIYVTEKHPEYDGIFGGPSRQIFNEMVIGPKWKGQWQFTSWPELRMLAPTFPDDVFKLTEDKIMEVIPWIEDVRVTDPEGTDLRFAVTAEEAEVWAKSAYLPNHIYMYPLQGTRDLYFREGIKKHIVPKTNGVLSGTRNHSGYYPQIKIYIHNGMVERVEGGGRYGELFRMLVENDRLRMVHYPFHPYPGLFYLYEGSLGTNPKYIPEYENGTRGGRSGLFHWGFGVESTIPEINEFAKKNGVPSDHGLHVQTYFTNYEIKLRGTSRMFKLAERGHLTALDDPEVKALASKYGKAEEILREDWVPAVPGVNVAGNYVKDYAKDPLSYIKAEYEQIQKGTYTYLGK